LTTLPIAALDPAADQPPPGDPPAAGPPAAGPPAAGPPTAGPPTAGPPTAGPPTAARYADAWEYVRERESAARTYANAFDRVMARGYGTRVVDTAGREYLDCLASAGTLALGHNHPRVRAAVEDFLRSGHVQQALDITTPAKHDFLRTLYGMLPPALATHAKVQFCGPSGADAIEAAVKLFKTATGRRTVLAFRGGYHGMTAGALSLTGSLSAKERVAGLMPDVHFLPYPYPYRCPFGLGGEQTAEVSLAYVERLFGDSESGIPKPAAVVVEAVQGEGGVVPAPAEWLAGLRRVTAEHDVPLVLDEVQTGFGRTGTLFAYQVAGIVPDAVVLSKAVGGGYPLSLLLYHERYDRWRPGAHAGTFRGNQIAFIAGAATLRVIAEEGLVAAARQKGERLRARLSDLAARHPEIGEVRGRGLMWGLEMVDPTAPADAVGSHPANPARALDVKRRCLEAGLLLESGGRDGAVLRLLPPLVVTDAELDQVVDTLDAVLSGPGRIGPDTGGTGPGQR
jgi:diaminobutyrate-2-oxoglutarate transaminase